MPSVSWSSCRSEVHFPHLMAGLTEVGLLQLGWEAAHGSPGHGGGAPVTQAGFLATVNVRATLGRWKDIFFRERAPVMNKCIRFCYGDDGHPVVSVCSARLAPHCRDVLPSPPSRAIPPTFICIPPMGTVFVNTFILPIGFKHKILALLTPHNEIEILLDVPVF